MDLHSWGNIKTKILVHFSEETLNLNVFWTTIKWLGSYILWKASAWQIDIEAQLNVSEEDSTMLPSRDRACLDSSFWLVCFISSSSIVCLVLYTKSALKKKIIVTIYFSPNCLNV